MRKFFSKWQLTLRLVTLVLPFFSHDVDATVHNVIPGQSIQLAVNEAIDSDTILLHDGNYTESTVLYGKRLCIGSLYMVDGDRGHIEATEVRGDTCRTDTSSCFAYCFGEPSTGQLVGLTLTGSRGTRWTEFGNAWAGGAIYIYHAGVSVENCNIANSSSEYGGGIFCYGYIDYTTAQLSVNATTFNNCVASSYGGGVIADLCSLRVHRCRFEADSALLDGGGATTGQSFVVIDSSEFLHCYSWTGGISVLGSVATISNCLFDSNGAPDPAGGFAHLSFSENVGSVSGCTFSNGLNSPSIELSGVTSPLQFSRNIVVGNSSPAFSGIVVVAGQSIGQIAYNHFVQNTVGVGTIHCTSMSRVRIHHNVFNDNSCLFRNCGSVLSAIAGARPIFDSNVVAENMGNTISYEPTLPAVIHAEQNWWGDPSGPYQPNLNPQGRGDTILQDSVYFSPWLSVPPDTSMSSPANPHRLTDRPRTWDISEVYPNPFNTVVRIEITGFTQADFELVMYNVLGAKVAVIHRGLLTASTISFVATPSFASGIYFIRASGQGAIQIRKLVFLK